MNLPHCSILVLLGRTACGCPRSRGLPWSSWPRDNSAPAVWSPSPPTWPARVTLRCAAPWNQVTDGNSAGFLACRFTCDIWASLFVCVCFLWVCVTWAVFKTSAFPGLYYQLLWMITIHQGNPYQPTDIKGRRRDFEHCWHVRASVQTLYILQTLPTRPTYVGSFVRSFLCSFACTYICTHIHTSTQTHTIHI